MKIYKNDHIFLEKDFFDNILLPNLYLDGSPLLTDSYYKKGKESNKIQNTQFSNPPVQYRIECLLDSTKYPEWIDYTNIFDWKMYIYGTDNIGFVKDTIKEDKEKAMIVSWEVTNPGRSLKAKGSRAKYLEEKKYFLENFKNSQLETSEGKEFNHNFKINI